VSAADNHALDYGVEGLRRHLDALREMGTTLAGVGGTAAEAAEPAFVTANGTRVALSAAASSLGLSRRFGTTIRAVDGIGRLAGVGALPQRASGSRPSTARPPSTGTTAPFT
jgi:poly-gamma-glutamate capsule biosynthesis protein CapA/YwtB (metallophosphatase superfamily)